MSTLGKWCGSTCEESYYGEYKTPEEAEEAFPEEYGVEPGERFWIGRSAPFVPVVGGGHIIDEIRDQAYEAAGEHAEDFLDTVPKAAVEELSRELTEVVVRWMERHKEGPTFFRVVDVRKCVAPQKAKP